jgi:predicted nucleic acid-binding protein
MSVQFLDTNIFLRHLLGDIPEQSRRASTYFSEIEEGTKKAHISDIVVLEIVFTLERAYKRTKFEIQSAVLPLLELPGILLPGKRKFREVFLLYVEKNISFADAYHAVTMQKLNLTEIVSFDRDFDKLPAINRIEP